MKKEFNFREIKELLPYDYPFLFLDKATLVELGKKIICIKNVTGNEHYFAGHFKDNPVMPGIILIEAMAQTTSLLGRLSYLRKKRKIKTKASKVFEFYLAGIKNLRFLKPVYPGDQICIQVEIKARIKNTELVEARAFVGSDLVCHGELLFGAK